MRLQLSLIPWALACLAAGAEVPSAAPACADLHLVPAVRECAAVASISAGRTGIAVAPAQGADDQFAAKDLADALAGRDAGYSARGLHLIRLERAGTPAARLLLVRNHLTFEPAMHDEGYAIVPDGRSGLAVIAETPAGIFYGAQTVKQLVRGHGREAVLLAPTVRDWPAMAHRGLSDDWSRGPLPNMDFLRREVRTLAAFKMNVLSPYFEHTFAYSSTPVAAFPGGSMTPDEARELVAYAARYHIEVIPEQESFGHLHHVLKFEAYSPAGETVHGAVLAPGDTGSLPRIGSWFGELAKIFPAPYAHIGADETFELGLGRTRQLVTDQGLDRVYLDFLGRIHETLAPYHRRLLFWGDIAVKSPQLVATLPKDMIAVPWEYDAKSDFSGQIEPFRKAGLETWVAPGVSNWNRVYPNNNEALGNIRAFVRDGQRLGATGELNTVWNDDGEGIFDENWFGVLFGAAAGWQPGESSEQAFEQSYGLAFHGDPTGKINDAERALMEAHALFRKAKLGDARDSYFWADPFSPEGRELQARLVPVAAELRLDAERAITLVAEARAAGRLDNQEALDALELGARRIDFIAYKAQIADECSSIYNQALQLSGDQGRRSEVSELLGTISSNNGRLEDIRDGYALLGELYERAWLRDNRPYWLANNRARYERATILWLDRAGDWEKVMSRWRSTHTLLPAAEAGLALEPPAATR